MGTDQKTRVIDLNHAAKSAKDTENYNPADAQSSNADYDTPENDIIDSDEDNVTENMTEPAEDNMPENESESVENDEADYTDNDDEADSTFEISRRKTKKKKSRWISPIRIFRDRITDENIDDETAARMVNIIGIASGLAFIVVIGLAAFIIYQNFSSFSSQYNQAVEYENAGDLAKAASSYEKAIQAASQTSDKITARMALANLYMEEGSQSNAIYYYEQVVDIDPDNREAIEILLSIYEENNDMSSILALAKKVSGEDTKELFEDYLLSQPVFNYKSGTYDEDLTIEIESADAQIYYTMDGTEATEESTLYTGPITITEGTTVFHAMAVNANGLMSENIEVTYEIIASAPDKPEITPESGTYREITVVEAEIPDGCTAYYTLDGTYPTTESAEFTGSLTLPLGNHIFSLIFVNQNGVSSEVARKVYDFILSADVTKSEAISIVLEGLINSGTLLDDSGTAADSSYGTAEFTCEQILTINDAQFYRVDLLYSGNGAFSSYAVEITSGAVFSLLDDNGNYTLVGF